MSTLYTGSLDLSKIDKNKLYTHKDGRKFLNVSVWVNENPDEDWKAMSIQQQTGKEEPNIYLANCKKYVKPETNQQFNEEIKEQNGPTDDLPF